VACAKEAVFDRVVVVVLVACVIVACAKEAVFDRVVVVIMKEAK
jgi:hypothetical protein